MVPPRPHPLSELGAFPSGRQGAPFIAAVGEDLSDKKIGPSDPPILTHHFESRFEALRLGEHIPKFDGGIRCQEEAPDSESGEHRDPLPVVLRRCSEDQLGELFGTLRLPLLKHGDAQSQL